MTCRIEFIVNIWKSDHTSAFWNPIASISATAVAYSGPETNILSTLVGWVAAGAVVGVVVGGAAATGWAAAGAGAGAGVAGVTGAGAGVGVGAAEEDVPWNLVHDYDAICSVLLRGYPFNVLRNQNMLRKMNITEYSLSNTNLASRWFRFGDHHHDESTNIITFDHFLVVENFTWN